jgi:hypothetical protein
LSQLHTGFLAFSEPRAKRVHAVLPIRVSYWQEGIRTGTHLACTYDIGPSFARVTGLREGCRVGDLIVVERGRNKAPFHINWVGESDLRGQFGIQCVDDAKVPWAMDLQEAEEIYDPVIAPSNSPLDRIDRHNRRRTPRFMIDHASGVLHPVRGTALLAEVQDISEFGCQVALPGILPAGSEVEFSLKVSEIPVKLHGKICHAAHDMVSGIEFQKIRRGDRPLLQWLLRKLKQECREAGNWNLEVLGEPAG